ncbi:ubiquinone biosynthesis hydroxylase [Ahrensia sp. 13_GOM-1096m]|uniref:ubiquinone biosynthesis hydroxylase n=1 Tax=Ahrensia sp. 13_GOM-1096m TaxID=1380380 RepID=UPI0006845633|nr:ubiquinone biosynthesis hydroxylase [Ahrensia sp. 13_GOM-1096m]
MAKAATSKKPAKQKLPQKADTLIAGAGYVGLLTAVSIASSAPSLKIVVVDAAPENVWQNDGRASAVAAAAVRMLEQLNCWQDILPHAQPINEMVVTDSRTSDPVRPVFLTFAGNVEEGEPFARMIPNVEMIRALRKRCDEFGVDIIQGVGVTNFENSEENQSAEIHLADGNTISAKLLIACDGVNSRLRDMAGIKTVHWDYGQSGIVATIAHERDHEGRAEEHFLPAGPFAILPLTNNRSSIVWTESTEKAQRLIEGDEFTFDIELEQRFGLKLGDIKVETKPRAYPLGLTLARDFVKPRFALAGDAAHGIHPIAGQGLNLGFKDAAALAEKIVEAHRLGLDIGAINVLEEYQRWRRFDTVQMGATTDILNRLFSNDIAPLRALRSFGLGVVDRLPKLKDYFISQASGISGQTPRLLRGEKI